MAKNLKFIYVITLFVFIFLVIIRCDSAFVPNSGPCTTDKDCKQVKGYMARCRKGYCMQSVKSMKSSYSR